jgi:hypothetical protein
LTESVDGSDDGVDSARKGEGLLTPGTVTRKIWVHHASTGNRSGNPVQ